MHTRIAIIGDTHCGADSGLLGPERWVKQLEPQQSVFWGWYVNALRELGQIDAAFFMGDMVDGEGKKSNINTIIPNTLDQAESAIEVCEAAGVPGNKMYFVRGTPFHSTGTYNYEDPIAKHFGAPIEDELYLKIHGLRILLRHVAGRSDTAYGQGTPLFRDSVKDLLDAAIRTEEPADLILHGHVHYSAQVTIGKRTAITNPCLQLPGSVFGRKCRSMYYDVGIGVLDVFSGSDYRYTPILMPLKPLKGRSYVEVC